MEVYHTQIKLLNVNLGLKRKKFLEKFLFDDESIRKDLDDTYRLSLPIPDTENAQMIFFQLENVVEDSCDIAYTI
jgi:hypothetical protein